MHLLNVNGVEKYLVMCEHPNPQTWENFILCFNVKDIDILVYSNYKYVAEMIKDNSLIEFGENRVNAEVAVPVCITKNSMSYPHYEKIRCHTNNCIPIDAEEGRNYMFSLWDNVIGMGETCLRSVNTNYNIDLYFIGVEYINMPLGSEQRGIIVKTEDADVSYISRRMNKKVSKENIHVFCFENSRRYIVGKKVGFYKNRFSDYELYDGRI